MRKYKIITILTIMSFIINSIKPNRLKKNNTLNDNESIILYGNDNLGMVYWFRDSNR